MVFMAYYEKGTGKNGRNYRKKKEILDVIHESIYDSQYVPEFEQRWKDMIQRYSLEDHEWLAVMYNERHRWVPCFLKPSFWAGMSTTQRSESINAFFDNFVNSKTTLKQFVEQYGRALRSKAEKEFHADKSSFAKTIPCVTSFEMEEQVQEIYTLAKFKEFQDEHVGTLYCDLLQSEGDRKFNVKEVRKINGFRKTINFVVEYEPLITFGICSCHLFEFRGTVCRNLIVVLLCLGLELLPEVYLLKRWRKDVKRAYTNVKINYDGWITTVEKERFRKLCKTFESLANMIADDDEKYQSVLLWLESQLSTYTPLQVHPSSICGNLTSIP
ncbi:unnamed protein product [Cuscuta europaea]|uniref:Protein FAR1-RELATED SEQUENCE n=1 Tax=Cuscuta europaea TaxID=41803 RepID=A0A9P1ELU6_CUSEU|nr:unnamed protein product [Cuscuta europaea]